jgi:GNAT superfamily N-acetyltransferase
MIELLPKSEWHTLDSIFEGEFRSAMPDPRHSEILVMREDDELIGFLVIELAVWLPELYVAPNHRGSSAALRLLNYVGDRVPEGKSILCTPDSKRLETWCERKGLKRIQGTLFRKAA